MQVPKKAGFAVVLRQEKPALSLDGDPTKSFAAGYARGVAAETDIDRRSAAIFANASETCRGAFAYMIVTVANP
jgi:hypothetical protein